jgi:hypothetical protein
MQQFENTDYSTQDIPDSVWNIRNMPNELAFPNDIQFNNHPSLDELVDAIEQVTELARNMTVQHEITWHPTCTPPGRARRVSGAMMNMVAPFPFPNLPSEGSFRVESKYIGDMLSVAFR